MAAVEGEAPESRTKIAEKEMPTTPAMAKSLFIHGELSGGIAAHATPVPREGNSWIFGVSD